MPATINSLQFELERGFKLLKSTTTMPDNTQLGYDGDPNDATASTSGQTLLVNAPLGTGFIQQDGTSWQKTEVGIGGSWTNNGIVIDDDGNPTAPPVVVDAVAKSAGASEYVLAEEGFAKTLHTSPDLLVLTNPEDGKALTWHRWSNETGDSDWMYAEESNQNSLHMQDRSALTNHLGELLEWHYDPQFITTPALTPVRSWQGGHKEIKIPTFRTDYPCNVNFEVLGYGGAVVHTEYYVYDASNGLDIPYRHLTLLGGTVRQDTQRYEPASSHTINITLTDINTGGQSVFQSSVYFEEYTQLGIDTELSADFIFEVTENDAVYDYEIPQTYLYNATGTEVWSRAIPMQLWLYDRYDVDGFPPSTDPHNQIPWDPWQAQRIYDHYSAIKRITLYFRKPSGWIEPAASYNRVCEVKLVNGYWPGDPRHVQGMFTDSSTIMPASVKGYKIEFTRVRGQWFSLATPLDAGTYF